MPAAAGYGDCFDEALMGSAKLERIAPELLVTAWQKAFASDDPSDGGCPNIQA